MSNALMIPEVADAPAYAINPELAREMNADAAAGISTGFPSRIKLSGKQFVLVNGKGEETVLKVSDLSVEDDGNAYLPAVMLLAKKEIQKAWYATKFNPNDEGKAPDCFSNDGVAPASSITTPQCETCAGCPQNAWGSGSDQNGNATKGKACSDAKILVTFCKGGIYKLKLPPASLGNWGVYVGELSKRGYLVGNVRTLLGFDEKQTFPVLTFSFGGFVKEEHVPALLEKSLSYEAQEILNEVMTASAPATPAIENKPAVKTEKEKAVPVVKDDGLGLDEPIKQEAVKQEPVAEAVTTPDEALLAEELGLDDEDLL